MRTTTRQTFQETPLLFNWAESGKTPLLPLSEIRALGFILVIFPVSLLFAATHAMLTLLEYLKTGETAEWYGLSVSLPLFMIIRGNQRHF